eukprot:8835486-Lingulodinium_polyedra.AAC.1
MTGPGGWCYAPLCPLLAQANGTPIVSLWWPAPARSFAPSGSLHGALAGHGARRQDWDLGRPG